MTSILDYTGHTTGSRLSARSLRISKVIQSQLIPCLSPKARCLCSNCDPRQQRIRLQPGNHRLPFHLTAYSRFEQADPQRRKMKPAAAPQKQTTPPPVNRPAELRNPAMQCQTHPSARCISKLRTAETTNPPLDTDTSCAKSVVCLLTLGAVTTTTAQNGETAGTRLHNLTSGVCPVIN
jgi:hypothetical protein